jgi:hypothetical protein
MPETTNNDRAEWAETALAAYMAETGTDEADAPADLVNDIIHVLRLRRGFDLSDIMDWFADRLQMATWEAEEDADYAE